MTDKSSQPMETDNNLQKLAKDPKRKAKSNDPGWKFAFWPNLSRKDVVKCILCGNENHGGINRFKQQLIGSFPDIVKCPKTTTEIVREMNDYVQSKKIKSVPVKTTTAKDKGKDAMPFSFKKSAASSKSIGSMLMRTPEQVVEDRHMDGPSQTTLERKLRTRTKEEKKRVHMHIANFLYENGIPFNVANSRSYKIMDESKGQYGLGLKPPTFHEIDVA